MESCSVCTGLGVVAPILSSTVVRPRHYRLRRSSSRSLPSSFGLSLPVMVPPTDVYPPAAPKLSPTSPSFCSTVRNTSNTKATWLAATALGSKPFAPPTLPASPPSLLQQPEPWAIACQPQRCHTLDPVPTLLLFPSFLRRAGLYARRNATLQSVG
jgi:hypothetical protein